MISKKDVHDAHIRCMENAVETINCFLSYYDVAFRVSLDYDSEIIIVDDLPF